MNITRITLEEAKTFIPADADYLKPFIKYFTMTVDDGWDVVKYYTDKKKSIHAGKEGDETVYILSNPAYPEMLKIGYTSKPAEIRSNQISKSTGVPLEFEILFQYACFKGEKIEKEVHKKLSKYRVNSRKEFFTIPLDQAISTILEVGDKYL
jgi:hypothetical protein